ncbi:MAG: SpoIIE family protein phosphatase [Armatimonadetes bacterium]|nr:SpoIIE family protein phosphatase [Armatimonadota bacterium]
MIELAIALTLAAALSIGLVLVLALIQWGAARRRELLYFHLTLEKPVSAYFREARAAREYCSRLMAATLVLLARELILISLALSGSSLSFYRVGSGAALWMHVVGLSLLAYALLYPNYGRRTALPLLSGLTAAAAAAGLAAAWGWLPSGASITVARGLQIAVGAGTFAAAAALPPAERSPSLMAVPVCAVGPVLGIAELHQAAAAFFYGLLAAEVYRDTLDRYEELESGHHRLQREREVIIGFLERIGGAYQAALDLEEVLRLVTAAGVETTGAGAGAIFLLDARTNELQMSARQGPFPPLYRNVPITDLRHRSEELAEIAGQQRFALGEGVVGQVAATGKPVRITDARQSGILVGEVGDPVRRQSMLLMPIVFRAEVMGVVAVLNKRSADAFSEEDQFLLGTLAEQAAFYIHNARMVAALAAQERVRRELQIARDIQRLLLPADAPEVPGFDLHALGRPALEMGGDYYDFFPVTEGHLGIVIGDVSGKGMPAALTMAMLRTVIRTHAQGDTSPSRVLVRVNATLSADLPRDAFVSVLYGVLDIRERAFVWARAGHEPAILLRDSGAEPLTPGGAAIGVLGGDEFAQSLESHEVRLRPGDALILYTDGITEAMDASGEEFGMERFLQALQSGAATSAQARARRIEEAVMAFAGQAPQQDDITLVVLSMR